MEVAKNFMIADSALCVGVAVLTVNKMVLRYKKRPIPSHHKYVTFVNDDLTIFGPQNAMRFFQCKFCKKPIKKF